MDTTSQSCGYVTMSTMLYLPFTLSPSAQLVLHKLKRQIVFVTIDSVEIRKYTTSIEQLK